jgi:hypothetical protein
MLENKAINLENIFDFFAEGWDKRDIDGFIFDNEMRLEGLPISWFFRRFFTTHNSISALHAQRLIKKGLNNKKLSLFEKKHYRFASFFLRKAILLNETLKTFGCNVKPFMSDAIILTYGSHISKKRGKLSYFRLDSLLEELNQSTVVTPSVLVAEPLPRSFLSSWKSRKNYFNSIFGSVDGNIKRKAKSESLRLSKIWNSLSVSKKRRLFHSNSLPLYDLMEPLIDFYFSKEFFYILALYYYAWENVLNDTRAKVVVLTAQNGLHEKTLMAAASKYNIPVVFLQHGTGLGIIDPEFLANTKIAVFSEYYTKRLGKQGVPEEQIVITGPLIFENIVKYIKNEPKRDKLGNVVIITEPFVTRMMMEKEPYFDYISKLCNQINKLGVNCYIKLHPAETHGEEYEKTVSNLDKFHIVTKPGPDTLYPLINNSDVVVEFGSTVAFEAMILGKPVVTIGLLPTHGGNYPIIKESGATLEVAPKEDISSYILSAFNDDRLAERRKDTVNNICGPLDDNTAKRLRQLIEDSAMSKK